MDFLEHIDEARNVLARYPLDREKHSMGRETPADIVIDNKAISREHGAIRRAGSYLYFQDYGSTNGSWVNGEKLIPQIRILLRHGDILQLSNSLFRIHRDSPYDRSALVVLKEGNYIGDHPILSSGVVLIIGAGNEYYPLEDGSVVFEVNKGELFVSARRSQSPITRNASRISGDKALSDKDEVRIEQYAVLVHVPELKGSGERKVHSPSSPFGEGVGLASKSNFGKFREDGSTTIIDGTLVEGVLEYGEDATTLSGFPSRDTRRTLDDASGGYDHKEFEQKVISWVGVFLLGILFMLFIWWLL